MNMNQKALLKRIAVIVTAMLMLVPYAAVGETAEEIHFGKTVASVEKKTVPYVSDFGKDGQKESETNIYFVNGGDIPYVALSEYMPFLSEVMSVHPSLITWMSDLKTIAQKNEQLTHKVYGGYDYRLLGFSSLQAGDQKAEGYTFSYSWKGVAQVI